MPRRFHLTILNHLTNRMATLKLSYWPLPVCCLESELPVHNLTRSCCSGLSRARGRHHERSRPIPQLQHHTWHEIAHDCTTCVPCLHLTLVLLQVKRARQRASSHKEDDRPFLLSAETLASHSASERTARFRFHTQGATGAECQQERKLA